jgi:methylenetetrahydrofolate dehydrogenase (NADP+)/methenyltetrahydrofolate cyclohydrolase
MTISEDLCSYIKQSGDSVTARVIDGNALAETMRGEIATEVAAFQQQTGVTPHLTVVLVGENPASEVYVGAKQKACAKAGMQSTLVRLPASATQTELLDVLNGLNADANVHGILVQLPLPPQIDAEAILDAVSPHKDVDAFHPENVGLIAQGRPRFLPCTPYGVQQILVHAGVKTAGAHVVIIGRSDIVGKPLALMLMQKGAGADSTVTVCHSRTRNLPEVAREADILVAAIGQPRFVTADMVRPGAAVIDVGINRVEGKLCGDVDFAAVCEVAAVITPVPKGVGPMTVTMLLKNTLTAARLAHGA